MGFLPKKSIKTSLLGKQSPLELQFSRLEEIRKEFYEPSIRRVFTAIYGRDSGN
jgi:hypothetical protein